MNLDTALDTLARDPDAALDIAAIALGLARDEFPDLDVEAHLSEITAMAHEARSYVRGDLSARVQGLRRYLFHDMGFHGNVREYYDPRNSYLHLVLERRTGIPISLAAVVMAIGRRTGLTIEGVGLPGHFIVKAVGSGQEIYIDCFHGGRILTPWDCENLVRQVTGMPFHASRLTLQALPLGLMVQRMLGNLRSVYLHDEDFPRVLHILKRMHQLDPHNAGLRRDLGVCLVRLGHAAQALAHLRAYLAVAAEASDAAALRRIVKNLENGSTGKN
ncbi:MAG: transglutaminase family protein [Planctomycetes bacterium]|nr:transglutaminase family protein [Planctomycetota bacterium]